ncbi:hypothetical protein LX81_03163 [Palleronia aestuarii]|uniref:Uncharacterized protein n=1 Tax=Palleronia aestuarii TaxID=568105 RepID=A0A2W7N9S8_9RHOB|nr:hypothetical protein [Palleronia aestuarii]PZX13614.1 hypothetical protein LX81_03163 [Palleronia aestuarii]
MRGSLKLGFDFDSRCDAARASGRRYLLVCVDMFDRMRGDRDMGFYYPAFDRAQEVADYIRNHAIGVPDPSDNRDRCEAIAELGATTIVHDPAQWLNRSAGD